MFDSSREIVMRGEEQSEELMKLFKKVNDTFVSFFPAYISF